MNLLNFQVLIIVGIMDISTSTHSISNPCTKIQKILQVLSEFTGFSNCRGCIHNSVGFLEAQQLSRVFLDTFLKFPNFLTEIKVFSSSVPRKNPLSRPFYLFSFLNNSGGEWIILHQHFLSQYLASKTRK